MAEEPEKPPPTDGPASWGGHFTPDSDDLRPFPEVPDEWVDEQIRELVRAAHAAAAAKAQGLPPVSPPASRPRP